MIPNYSNVCFSKGFKKLSSSSSSWLFFVSFFVYSEYIVS